MSMGPLHGAVLGAAAVVSSPALWLSLVEGTLPLADALTRYLVCVGICWALLNAVAALVMAGPVPATDPGGAVDPSDPAVAAEAGRAHDVD
ncbi:hypothetical protein [Nocardioides solisilvae]|uniref:hypothetical protein n=1 Tax=Nocardioides solisilvae TaxID=1542435 RepID=UPI0013A53950|nr:hypothetical protein [Nocardioides solisilvae]